MDIKLKSVEVKRDYSLNNTLKVYFSDYNISVIYGENGCGKTTILRLINAFLAQNDSVLSQEKVLLMSMTYQFEGVETKVLVEKKERTESIKDEDGNIMEQCALSCCAGICVLQTVYKNSEKIRYIFLSDSGCNSGGIYSFGAGFVRQQQIYKKSPGE